MKIFKRVILFIVSLATLSFLGFLFTFWEIKNVVIGGFLLSYLFIWLYPDKIILGYLGAKEINQSDNESLFQILKNIIFRRNILIPKIYSISNFECCDFMLVARNERTLVLTGDSLQAHDTAKLRENLELILINKDIAWSLITNGMAIIISIVSGCELLSRALSFGNKKLRILILYITVWLMFPIIFTIIKIISPKNEMDYLIKNFLDFMVFNLSDKRASEREISNQLIMNIYSRMTNNIKVSLA
jgi:hypothetical protein